MDIFAAGTLSYLTLVVGSNSFDNTITVTSRKNGGAGAMSVSVATTLTGLFQDTSNSDSLSSGDECCFKFDPGSITTGTINFYIGATFDATGSTVGMYSNRGSSSTASTTYYMSPAGANVTPETTEATANCKVKAAGSFSGLCVNVVLNGRTITTVASRINGSNGNLSVSITASTTGRYVDSTHSDTVAVDDLFNISFTTGTGAGTVDMRTLCLFTPSGTETIATNGNTTAAAASIGNNITRYFVPGGIAPNSTETSRRLYPSFDATFAKLSCYISTNTIAATSTLRMRVNGSNGNQSLSIGSTATGWFHDTTNEDAVSSSSYATISLVTGVSATNTMKLTSLTFTQRVSLTTYSQTVTAKARVLVSGNDKTVTAKARMKLLGNDKTVTAKARVLVVQSSTIQAKARIKETIAATIDAKARILLVQTQTVTAKARILVNQSKTVDAKARLLNTEESTVDVKARILQTDTATVTAKARILVNTTQTNDARARLLNTVDRTLTAKARILLTNSDTVTAKANLVNLVSVTVAAKARVKVNESQSVASKARVKATTAQTITAKASIAFVVEETVTAKANIVSLVSVTVQAKARMKSTLSQTIQTLANIKNTSTRTLTAKAKIWAARIGITVGRRAERSQRGLRYTESG